MSGLMRNESVKFDAGLLAQWTRGHWKFGVPVSINGVSADSRTLVAGNLFVAIKGPHYNGHNFIKQACAKGAAGIVVSHERVDTGIPKEGGTVPVLCVRDTAAALLDMAAGYRRETGVEVIAVTGSVGKTTVKEMVADVLSVRMTVARTIGNWNNELILPLSILSMKSSTRIGVFEVGMNHPGEISLLCQKLGPDWGLMIAIGPVHLEFFESIEAIAVEKAELLRSLPHEGVAVLLKDDPYYDMLRTAVSGRVITVGFNSDADYTCAVEPNQKGRIKVLEQASSENFSLKMPLPGRHMVTNALFAIAVARGHGLSWEDIRGPLEHYKTLPMRWECKTVNGVVVVNDAYNANPMSMAAALETFANERVNGKKWLVLAGMLELGQAELQAHRDLGISISRGGWAGLITVGHLGKIIANSAERAGMNASHVFQCEDHAEAAQLLSRKTAPGDAVLLKASRGEHLEDVITLWKMF